MATKKESYRDNGNGTFKENIKNIFSQYYKLDRVLKTGAVYIMMIGERSRGKSFAVLEHCIKDYFETGAELVMVRRWDSDLRGQRGQQIFADMETKGIIKKLSKGEWTGIYYWSGRWYFCKYDKKSGKRITAPKPFAYALSINMYERHDKSTQYPLVKNIFFDEFMAKNDAQGGDYIPDEFVSFMNILSGVIRDREDMHHIFMAGNTINHFSPYFREMGLEKVKDMKPGDIDVYTMPGGVKIAVEFTDGVAGGKKSDKYFAFKNSKLSMITGKNGAWQLDAYPHKPREFKPKDVVFSYYLKFDDQLLCCDIVALKDSIFTYCHRPDGLTKIDPKRDLFFSENYNPLPNWRRNISKAPDNLGKKIYDFIVHDNIYFEDNVVGEHFYNFLSWSLKQ